LAAKIIAVGRTEGGIREMDRYVNAEKLINLLQFKGEAIGDYNIGLKEGFDIAQKLLDNAPCFESDLSPDEITAALSRLAEYDAAEREGRLVRLPCKVGDTVFTIELDCKDNPDHSQMCFCWNKSCKECDKSYLRVWENRNKTADIRSIVAEMGLCGESGGFGKTVFLTYAEASAAMKGEGE
jgi:hypothetical protein